MSMSSCTTLTSFANMAAVSRGRLVISMLQRIGSLAWLRPQKRIKMHSRCQLVWTCFGSMRLTFSCNFDACSEIPSWQLAHLLCTVAFRILRCILFSLLLTMLTPHWVILHTQCNATYRTEAGVEADAVSYNMLFSACSKCFDLSWPVILDESIIWGSEIHVAWSYFWRGLPSNIHSIYIQYTFNTHWDYHHFFLTESRWVLRLSWNYNTTILFFSEPSFLHENTKNSPSLVQTSQNLHFRCFLKLMRRTVGIS